MFISKIVLCNMFAYYGEVSIEFRKDFKNLYCIYGDNGYGKTSFIRCAKLLFLGTGLLNQMQKPHPVIERFSKNKLTVNHFIRGNAQWRGILNTKACSELTNEFFIYYEGYTQDKRFSIKRSWHNVYENLKEILELEIGADVYINDEAQSRLDMILPQNFVEFFFFDGEEIESISDNLQTQLREKIEEILHIKPLNIVIEQIKKLDEELRHNEIKNEKLKNELFKKNKDKENKNADIELKQKELQNREYERDEYQKDIEKKTRDKDQYVASVDKEIGELEIQKDRLEERIANIKEESLKQNLKQVIFAGNELLLTKLEKELDDIENNGQRGDIEILKRLLPDIKEIIINEVSKKSSSEKLDANKKYFSDMIDSIPLKLESKIFSQSHISTSLLMSLRLSLQSARHNTLQKDISNIKNSKDRLTEILKDIEELSYDDSIREKKQILEQEISALKTKEDFAKKDIETLKDSLKELRIELEIIERDIFSMEQGINTERIEDKLHLLECLKRSIEEYKNRLIPKLKDELHIFILENYQKLLPNDNVANLEINDNFEIKLKDSNGKNIIIANQSSGQKQILAISILWALSRLSNSNIPFIMDTPLSRIDFKNRARIIQQFYKQESQVIILPHAGEMGVREYEFARPNLAGLYKIDNSNDRVEAKIKVASIDEII